MDIAPHLNRWRGKVDGRNICRLSKLATSSAITPSHNGATLQGQLTNEQTEMLVKSFGSHHASARGTLVPSSGLTTSFLCSYFADDISVANFLTFKTVHPHLPRVHRRKVIKVAKNSRRVPSVKPALPKSPPEEAKSASSDREDTASRSPSRYDTAYKELPSGTRSWL